MKSINKQSFSLLVLNDINESRSPLSKTEFIEFKKRISRILDVNKNKLQILNVSPTNFNGVKLNFASEEMLNSAFSIIDGQKGITNIHTRRLTKRQSRIIIKVFKKTILLT